MEVKRINKNEIIEEIKQGGYELGQLIDYKTVHELCVRYGKGLNEEDFAQIILGIKHSNFSSCKNKGTKVRILKAQEKTITEERQKIIEEIIKAGYNCGQSVNYNELQELGKRYGKGLKEVEFAKQILSISHSSYYRCKNKGTRVKILKAQEKSLTEEERQEIIEELIKAGYKSGQLINYNELQELSTRFGSGLKEVEFAQKILGTTYNNYNACKYTGTKVRVLKAQGKIIIEKERQEIVKELIESGYKPGQSIDYNELQELSKKFGRGLIEVDFAQKILDVTYGNYQNCKNKGQKIRILKAQEKSLTEEERQEIIEELIKAGYKSGQLINYNELQELSERFGRGLKEVDFAKRILEITYNNYSKCKNKGTNVIILKAQEKTITEEERQEIIEELIKAGYNWGQSINYSELQELSKRFGRGLKEVDFAQSILGITYVNYMTCKNKKAQVRIKNGIVIEKTREIIALYINKPQYYSKDDIKNICEEYGITIEDFITYVYIQNFYDVTPFKNSLENNARLWIGKVRMSVDFVNKNIERINQIAIRIAKYVCSIYRINQKIEDYKQDIIIFIIENMGDLEINLGDTDELFDIIGGKAYKYFERTIISKLKINNKYEGFYKTSRRGKEDGIFEVQYADESIDIESEVEEKIEGEIIDSSEEQMDKCINLLKRYIEKGMGKADAIEKTARCMNIDAEQMLEYMKKYMLEKGKVKITKGKIIPVTPSGQGR